MTSRSHLPSRGQSSQWIAAKAPLRVCEQAPPYQGSPGGQGRNIRLAGIRPSPRPLLLQHQARVLGVVRAVRGHFPLPAVDLTWAPSPFPSGKEVARHLGDSLHVFPPGCSGCPTMPSLGESASFHRLLRRLVPSRVSSSVLDELRSQIRLCSSASDD